MSPLLLVEGGEGGPPPPPETIFTWAFNTFAAEGSTLDNIYGFRERFDPAHHDFLGKFWFDAIGFSMLASFLLILLAFLATRDYKRVPHGIQNVFEWIVGLLRGLVHGVIPPPQGDKYVPFLGTVFLFIFTMNIFGLIPSFRSPTMTLSTTAALGITTFVMVQVFAIRETGVVTYFKHFMGPVLFIAPLMFVVEIVGELARPLSLSLRLFGNIFGEDNVIENLLVMGEAYYIPVQLPMILFAIFTSFLQAFIFTMLAAIYIATKVSHDEEHGSHEKEGALDAHHG